MQIQGKWHHGRNPKKIPKPAKKKIPKRIKNPFEYIKPDDERDAAAAADDDDDDDDDDDE